MKSVCVIDYDSGNLFSVSKALEAVGGDVKISTNPGQISKADRLVLPGVGAIGAAMRRLTERGLADAIHGFVATGRPFLGICVGMQALLSKSYEFGEHACLGLIEGEVFEVERTDVSGEKHPIPHIGWNGLQRNGLDWSDTPLATTPLGSEFYFVHSFKAKPKRTEEILAITDYGGRQIVASIAKDNIFGFQFHPEKSGPAGLRVLESFLDLST